MGFYPKHLKVRRHKGNMRLIATAGISGCMFERYDETRVYPPNLKPLRSTRWAIHYNGDKISTTYDTKSAAASIYLMWWFDKKDMWPKKHKAAHR